MQNNLYISAVANHFEQEKNRKAAIYTLVVTGCLLLLFIFVSWTVPKVIEPPVDMGVEVNLGNSDFGMGDVAPTVPGEPAPEQSTQEAATPPAAQPVADESTEEPDPEDKEPAIVKPVEKPKVVIKPNKNPPVKKPIEIKATPAPPQPKPKAQMGQYAGGKGPGGNNQDGFNNVKNQGIAGGNGDQGKPNGNINSDSYKGNGGTGNSGVAITKGLSGRKITKLPSFEDDFNENAKIAVDIQIDESGNVTSAVFQPRGSTTSNSGMKAIAIRKARGLKFNAGDSESLGTIVFNFKLKS